MSDQDILTDEGGGESLVPEAKKGGFNILKLLMFVGIGILGVGLIVAIAVITVNIVVSQNGTPQTSTPVSEDYTETAPVWMYTEIIGEIKTRTADNGSLVVKITIGQDPNDKTIQEEITARKFQIQDVLRTYFAEKRVNELLPGDEKKIKIELMTKLNNMMKNKGVKEILFTRFDVIGE